MTPRCACVLIAFFSALPAATRGEEWKAARLWITGSDQSVWVVGASEAKSPALPIVQMWYAGKSGESPKQKSNLPPISGDPLYVAADAEALHILFTDLTSCDYFGNRAYSPGATWKEQCRGTPLAWAGDPISATVWAVVKTEDMIAPSTTSSGEEEFAVDVSRESPITLLRLRGGVWRRVQAPQAAGTGQAYWMASRNGVPHLFWAVKSEVFVAGLENGRWSTRNLVLSDREVRQAWAGATNDGLVFVVGYKTQNGAYELELHMEKEGAWSSAGTAREGNERLAVDPGVTGVAVVRGRLCVARPTASGEVEFGEAALGVAPALRFSAPLSLRRESFAPRPQWEDAITLGVLLAIMTAALWSRREDAVRTLQFPPGLAPAAVWKRVAASAIDIFPAFLATAAWWLPKYVAFTQEHGSDLTSELRTHFDNELRLESYATFLAYGLWCFIWEWLIGRTPGKIAFGCRVISVDGAAPSAGQCVVRNAMRVLMVSLGASGLLVTLMTILIVTRNRQRLGDLLAHTVVVEPGIAPREESEGGDDDSVGPFE